jgi:hypothetical protein
MRENILRYLPALTSALFIFFGVVSNWDDLPSWPFWISVLLLIAQVAMLEIELQQIKSGEPRLVYTKFWVEHKDIKPDPPLPKSIYGLMDDLPKKTSFDSDVQGFDDTTLFEKNVIGIWVKNDPKKRNEYSVAKGVVAHITFFTSMGDVEVDGRWWHKDSPLYPEEGTVDLDTLRKTTISQPDAARLVIAYKVSDRDLFYPFGDNTHLEILKQRRGRSLGKGKIEFQVVFDGLNVNPTKPLKFTLDGSYDNMKIEIIAS